MRKDDEKTSPATPSSLKLGLLKCIYTFLFTRTRMHFMQQNVYIHFLSRPRNCVFINTYTKHLYNQSKDSNYLRRAIDGWDLSLNGIFYLSVSIYGAFKFYNLYMGKIVTVHTIFVRTLKNLFIFIRTRNHIVITTSYQNRAYVEVSWRLRSLISRDSRV